MISRKKYLKKGDEKQENYDILKCISFLLASFIKEFTEDYF